MLHIFIEGNVEFILVYLVIFGEVVPQELIIVHVLIEDDALLRCQFHLYPSLVRKGGRDEPAPPGRSRA